MISWFDIGEDGNGESPYVFVDGDDLAAWSIDGCDIRVTLPSRSSLCRAEMSTIMSRDLFDALRLRSSFIVLRIRTVGEEMNGANVFKYRDDDIKKLTRIALGVYFEPFFRWNERYIIK